MSADSLARSVAARALNSIATASIPPTAVRCDAQSDYEEWTGFSGRVPDMVHGFANASTWAGVVSAVQTTIALWPGKKILWAFPLATGSSGNPAPTQNTTPAAVAAGAYDTYIDFCLEMMLAHRPSGRIPVRLGWEPMIFTSWPWGASSNIANARTDYISAFQHVATLMRAKSHRFEIVWCVANESNDYNGALIDPTDGTVGCYPGNTYVDVISIDAYCVGVDVSNAQTFEHLSQTTGTPRLLAPDAAYGLKYIADFARTNSKPIAVDEWGIGSDLPSYVAGMASFVADPRNRVLWHGYWNKNAGTQVSGVYPFPCRLSDNSNTYPFAKSAYKHFFCGIGTKPTEQPETSLLVGRATTNVADTRRAAYDTLYAGLRNAGLLSYLDALFVLCGNDNVITLLNLIGAGGFTTTVPRSTGRLASNGSVTFVPDKGCTGDGTTAAFLRGGGVNPSSALNRKFAQNDAHLGALMLTANANAGAQSYEVGVASSFIGCASAGARWVGRPNTAGTVTISAAAQGVGHIMWNRTGASAWASYFNGVASQSGTDASAAPTNDDLRICGIPGLGGGVNQIAIVHMGKSLPVSTPFNGPLTLYNLLYAFAHGIGAI